MSESTTLDISLDNSTAVSEVNVETTPLRVVIINGRLAGTRAFLPHELRLKMYMLDDDFNDIYPPGIAYTMLERDEMAGVKDEVMIKALQNKFSVTLDAITMFREDVQTVHDDEQSSEQIVAECKVLLDLMTEEAEKAAAKFVEGCTDFVSASEVALRLNTPGRYYTYMHLGQKMFFKTKSAKFVRTMFGNYIDANVIVVIDDGKNGLHRTEMTLEIGDWGRTKSLAETGLKELTLEHSDVAELIERGKRYVALTSKPAHVKHAGPGVWRTYRGPAYFKADGRVMIDIAGMRDMMPNYNQYMAIDPYRSLDRRGNRRTDTLELDNEVYALCVPFVYGFSLVAKRWGEYCVDNISDIKFREDAYDNLVMEKDQKDMIFALVDHVSTSKADVIDGKGGGTIFLLAGPPGVGKTLTAETIAERLQRPLYMVGIGELGTSPSELEENLTSVLSIAAAWNAVLLIDEADIFMEERSAMDVERNAMVGIFLRLLEYYTGVLFLTTNRASNLDQAFFSRISMSLFYDNLVSADRKKIWKNFGVLNKFDFTEMDYDILAEKDNNGREIKNVVKLATALASKESTPVTISHMLRVIDKGQHFKDSVNVKKTFFGKVGNIVKSWMK